MNSIDILLPTRNRPQRLLDLFASISETVSGDNEINVYLYIDNDDYEVFAFISLLYGLGRKFNLFVHIGKKNINLSQKWNKLAEISNGGILMHASDDILFRTKNWDQMVVNSFENSQDKIILAYGSDNIQNEKIATHGFYSKQHVEIIGYFLPPLFVCDGNDLWWTQIYRELGRLRYISEIEIEHKHFSKYLELTDNVYRNARKYQEESAKIYDESKDQRKYDLLKLETYIENFKDEKIL